MDLIYTPTPRRPPAIIRRRCVPTALFLSQDSSASWHRPGRAPGPCWRGAAAQAEAALRSMEAILLAADSSLAAVVNVTVYVRDVGLWDEVNRVYERRFGAHKPARAIVPTGELHYGALVEISAVALAQA